MSFNIEEIYECLFDDEALAKLPELMARIGNARSAVMHWKHRDGGYEVMGHSYFSQAIIEMTPEVLPIDPWTMACMNRPNELLRLDLVMPERSFETSPACKKLFFDNGDDTTQAMGMVIKSHHGEGVLGVHRGRTQPRFEAVTKPALPMSFVISSASCCCAANLPPGGALRRMRGRRSMDFRSRS